MKIKHAIREERLKILKETVLDTKSFETLFIYNNGDEFFSSLEETHDGWYLLPSNAHHRLDIETVEDKTTNTLLSSLPIFAGELRPEQTQVVEEFFKQGNIVSGLLQAPPGFGKTFTAASLIARAGVTTIILVHTKLLLYQWIDELKKLLPGQEIGIVGDGKFSVKPITVAIYLSVNNNIEKLYKDFSLVIVDECHRCPTETFSFTLNSLSAKTKIGLSATPSRKDGYHVLLDDYFTPFRVVGIDSRKLVTPSVEIVQTRVPFILINIQRDWSNRLSSLAEDPKYLALITEVCNKKIQEGRCLLVQSERITMLRALEATIPGSKILIGETKQAERDHILAEAGKSITAILTTKIFDEGISCHRLDTIILTCPSNNPIKLEQRVGRIVRLHPDKQSPLIVDFWFLGHIVNAQQNKRAQWYAAKGYKINASKI